MPFTSTELRDYLDKNKTPSGTTVRPAGPYRELVSKTPPHQTLLRHDPRYNCFAYLATLDFMASTLNVAWVFNEYTGHRRAWQDAAKTSGRPVAVPLLTLEAEDFPDAHLLNSRYLLNVVRAHVLKLVRTKQWMDQLYRMAERVSLLPSLYASLYDIEPDPAWPTEPTPEEWTKFFELDTRFASMVGCKLVLKYA
jgi:hypothetical protein